MVCKPCTSIAYVGPRTHVRQLGIADSTRALSRVRSKAAHDHIRRAIGMRAHIHAPDHARAAKAYTFDRCPCPCVHSRAFSLARWVYNDLRNQLVLGVAQSVVGSPTHRIKSTASVLVPCSSFPTKRCRCFSNFLQTPSNDRSRTPPSNLFFCP